MSNNTNLIISNQCIQCGSCLGLGTDWLEESADGTVTAKNGVFADANDPKVKELISICPVGAISVDTSIKMEDGYTILRQLINDLENLIEIPAPSREDLKFNVDNYPFNIPYPGGEGRYHYSSERAAQNAAEDEFNRIMYSKIDQIILQIISAYRVKKMTPYFSKEWDRGSVYAIHNTKITKLLQQAKDILERGGINSLPSDFFSFEIYPDNELTWKMLNKGELLSDEMIGTVRSEIDGSLSSYSYHYDTDEMDSYDGEGLFGKSKYKTKYCYRNVYSACKELAGDIKSACRYKDDAIENRAITFASDLINVYNKEASRILKEKVETLKSESEKLLMIKQ